MCPLWATVLPCSAKSLHTGYLYPNSRDKDSRMPCTSAGIRAKGENYWWWGNQSYSVFEFSDVLLWKFKYFISSFSFLSRISFANILCFKWCRTDGDAQISSYSYKPCYREVQSQAGFSGDGYITYGKDSGIDRRRTFVEHSRGKLSLSIKI